MIKFWVAFTFAGIFAFNANAADCSSMIKFISLDQVTPHMYYMRVHPTGKYLLFSGINAAIVNIEDPSAPKEIKTQMNREAYPVESERGWKWIASPNHEGKMKYFDFDDLLAHGPSSVSVYEDDGLNEYYHSSAELPDSTRQKLHFRTSIWSKLKYRDYTAFLTGPRAPQKVEKTKTKSLCPNLKNVGFRQPILSKDGLEIAGLTKDAAGNETTKVYKIESRGCKLSYDVGFNTAKVSFSYPKPGFKSMITFTATIANTGENDSASKTMRSGVWVYDPNKKRTYPISPADQAFDVTYPGFTADGKIIYATTNKGKFGVTVADAVQMMNSGCQ